MKKVICVALLFTALASGSLQAADVKFNNSTPFSGLKMAMVDRNGTIYAADYDPEDFVNYKSFNQLSGNVDALQKNYDTFSRNGIDSSESIKRAYDEKMASIDEQLNNLAKENSSLRSDLNALQSRVK